MKKQLSMIMIALFAFVVGAQAKSYYLEVAGVDVTSDNCSNITGEGISGKVSFDPETRTLTLENATINVFNDDGIEMNIMYGNSNIGVGDDFTLELKGENKITVSQDNNTLIHAVQTFITTYITGSGSLEANYDLEIEGDCYISGGCSIKATSIYTWDEYGTGYTLSISGADTEVEFQDDYAGISGYDYFELHDGLRIVKPKDGYYDESKKQVVNANGEKALWVKISANDDDDDWPYIVVAGQLVTSANASNVTGDGISGKVSYDPATATLTLDNVTISYSDYNSIVVSDDAGVIDHFTVMLIGDNHISNPRELSSSWQFYLNTTITGPGALNLDGAVYINGDNSLAIDGNCHLTARALVAWDFTDYPLMVSGAGTEIELSNNIWYFPSLTFNDGLEIVKPVGGYYAGNRVCEKVGGEAKDGVIIRAPKSYDLWVGGEQVTEANCSNIMGDGHVSYDEATNTLTLDNATINNDASDTDAASQYGKALVTNIPGLKVVVNGKTNITSSHNTAVTFQGDVTLCGSGTLTATAPTSLFVAQNSTLTVNGGVRLIAHGTVYYGIIGSLKPPSGTPTSNLVVEGANTEVRAYGPYGSTIRLESFSLNDGLVLNEPEGAHFEGMHVYDGEGNIVQKQWVVISQPYLTYDLWVGGRQVNEHNCYNFDGEYQISYNASNKKLSVAANIASDEAPAIESHIEGLTIEFKKDVTLTTTKEECAAIKTTGSMTLTGTGSSEVKVEGTAYGIKIDSGALRLSFLNAEVSGYHALEGNASNYSCDLAVVNATLTATSSDGEPAVVGFRNGILLSGCEITEPAGGKVVNGQIVDNSGNTVSHVVIGRVFNYALYIADTTVSASNCDDILGNGIFSFDPNTVTLTVKGSYTTTKEHLIWNKTYGLVIDVVADAELKSSGAVLYLENVTTLTGNGKLSLTSEQKGVEVRNSRFDIENANLYISGKYGLSGLSDKEYKLVVRNSRVQVEATMRAIYDFNGGIELENCAITLPDGGKVSNGEVVNSKGNTAKKVTIEPTGPATDINTQQLTPNTQDWYTLGGQKLNAKPTRSGIYICNGHKIVIK